MGSGDGWGAGLTGASTEQLKRLLRFVHRGEVVCPLTPLELTRIGLATMVGGVDVLRGLDERGLRAVLVAVLAERQ